jgi:ribonuclease HI
MEKTCFLFVDGSFDKDGKCGFGAFLLVEDLYLPVDICENLIKTFRFEQTSPAMLEIQTLSKALRQIDIKDAKIYVFTDSQNTISLLSRRQRFEHNQFITSKNKRHHHASLYQEFYSATDLYDCEFIKIKGHKPTSEKDRTDELFALVDKASRNALREYITD